jgi:hypothetical protein
MGGVDHALEETADPAFAVRALIELGGVAKRSALVVATSRLAVDRALGAGMIIAVRRGWYGLPQLATAGQVARAAGGRLCLESAALHHGWAVKQVPELPHVVLARGRKVPTELGLGRSGIAATSRRRTATMSPPAVSSPSRSASGPCPSTPRWPSATRRGGRGSLHWSRG